MKTSESLRDELREAFKHSLGPDFFDRQYLLAVSGGLDSMVLLDIFLALLPKNKIVVAHYNHGVRGPSALRDLKFVKSFCKDLDLSFHSGTRTSNTQGASEDSLRRSRYQYLEKTRIQVRADWIVTAHHLDDQLETFFMRLIRGTGLHGLAGIPKQRGKILRPLLPYSRDRLAAYAKKLKIKYQTDETNLSNRYFRNRVRNQLLPVFWRLTKRHGDKEKFFKRFQALQEELQALKTKQNDTNEDLEKLFVETPFWIRLPDTSFLKLTTDEMSQCIRLLYNRLGCETPTRQELKLFLTEMIKRKKSFSAPSNVQAHYSCGFYYFQNKSHQIRFSKQIKVLGQGSQFSYPETGVELDLENLDMDAFELRSFRPGDRYQNKKLKEVWLRERIPLLERPLIPVLARRAKPDIVWWLGKTSDKIRIVSCPFPFASRHLIKL